mmetsp:Transcript_14570/g.34237  ORF Transcript_14570/g.34237 Transcript_14570/m.34237 type:complete len:93 (+) Transcript_14570:76-354(+)
MILLGLRMKVSRLSSWHFSIWMKRVISTARGSGDKSPDVGEASGDSSIDALSILDSSSSSELESPECSVRATDASARDVEVRSHEKPREEAS